MAKLKTKTSAEVATHLIARATKSETNRHRNFIISEEALNGDVLREAHRLANVRRYNLEDADRYEEASFWAGVEDILISMVVEHQAKATSFLGWR